MEASTFVIAMYIFLIGFGVGMWYSKKLLYNILRIKSEDGTSEHLGDGNFVYIMNANDYRKIVLGIENDDE